MARSAVFYCVVVMSVLAVLFQGIAFIAPNWLSMRREIKEIDAELLVLPNSHMLRAEEERGQKDDGNRIVGDDRPKYEKQKQHGRDGNMNSGSNNRKPKGPPRQETGHGEGRLPEHQGEMGNHERQGDQERQGEQEHGRHGEPERHGEHSDQDRHQGQGEPEEHRGNDIPERHEEPEHGRHGDPEKHGEQEHGRHGEPGRHGEHGDQDRPEGQGEHDEHGENEDPERHDAQGHGRHEDPERHEEHGNQGRHEEHRKPEERMENGDAERSEEQRDQERRTGHRGDVDTDSSSHDSRHKPQSEERRRDHHNDMNSGSNGRRGPFAGPNHKPKHAPQHGPHADGDSHFDEFTKWTKGGFGMSNSEKLVFMDQIGDMKISASYGIWFSRVCVYQPKMTVDKHTLKTGSCRCKTLKTESAMKHMYLFDDFIFGNKQEKNDG